MDRAIRIAVAAGISATTLGFAWLAAAGAAQAEPRYHWCPGEQWSAWMGVNWNGSYCHDNHYLDNVPHDPEHWNGAGEFDPSFPPRPPGNYYPR